MALIGVPLALYAVFTFHYGSITIIPINIIFIFLTPFTFHYGSITIVCQPCLYPLTLIFTFHYGSITIRIHILFVRVLKLIYIPLWFNYYGCSTCRWNTYSFIYIPLWFNYYYVLYLIFDN